MRVTSDRFGTSTTSTTPHCVVYAIREIGKRLKSLEEIKNRLKTTPFLFGDRATVAQTRRPSPEMIYARVQKLDGRASGRINPNRFAAGRPKKYAGDVQAASECAGMSQ